MSSLLIQFNMAFKPLISLASEMASIPSMPDETNQARFTVHSAKM